MQSHESREIVRKEITISAPRSCRFLGEKQDRRHINIFLFSRKLLGVLAGSGVTAQLQTPKRKTRQAAYENIFIFAQAVLTSLT